MREQDKQPCLFLYKLQYCKRHMFLEKMRTKMYWAAIALNSKCFITSYLILTTIPPGRFYYPYFYRKGNQVSKMYLAQIQEGSLWPCHPEHARSCLISEAKQSWAWLVLEWETTQDDQVL